MRRPVERACVALALAVALAGAPRRAAAAGDEAAAASLFREGEAAYARGDFRAAALAFEEAYRRAPRGATMYDAGVAWEQSKEWGRAADDFEIAIADPALDAKHAADANKRLAEAQRRVGRVEVTAPAGARVSVGGLHEVEAPIRTHLTPGRYELEVRYASGGTAKRVVDVVAGSVASAAFEPEAAPPPPLPPAPSASRPPPAEPAPQGPPLRTIGWISLGAGAAGAIAASILGVEALHARDDFLASDERDASAHDRASSLRTGANVAWAAAAVFAVAGAALLVFDQLRIRPASRPVSGP